MCSRVSLALRYLLLTLTRQGAVFDVSFNTKGTEMVSCSDDRTIRRWTTHTGQSTAVYFGHEARVWKCFFMNNQVISVSEDSSCRLWKEDGECQVWGGHQGKSIWTAAVNPSLSLLVSIF